MADGKRAIAKYLAQHQGAHVRTVVSAMVESKAMCWNTAYRTIRQMEEEGSITSVWCKRAVDDSNAILSVGSTRKKTVKAIFLTLGDDGATSDPEVEQKVEPLDTAVGKEERRMSRLSEPLIQIGDKFGFWTVTGEQRQISKGYYVVPCRCQCGTEKEVAQASLKYGKSRSCGCMKGREVPDEEEVTE